MLDLREILLLKLEEIYGKRNPITSKFGHTTLGEIADQLCLSNSLITKLISGTATQGMYERSIKNLNRIQEAKELNIKNQKLQNSLEAQSPSGHLNRVLLGVVLFLLSALAILWNSARNSKGDDIMGYKDFSFDVFFNPDFENPNFLPYVPSNKVQEYCPCSGYEGDWELVKPYTIPIPFKKPGLYYVARSSDVKLKCASSVENERKGKVMHGFEIMKHELWMDSEHEPLVPKYFNSTKKQYTKEFYNLNFMNNQRYDKVAEFNSFFYNHIEISRSKIMRKGEPTGRYTTYINEEAVEKYKIDLKEILNHVVGDMIMTSCREIPNPYCNPNSLKEGESTLEFNCEFSIATENLGYGGNYPYVKGYRLINQHYSNNLLCSCDE